MLGFPYTDGRTRHGTHDPRLSPGRLEMTPASALRAPPASRALARARRARADRRPCRLHSQQGGTTTTSIRGWSRSRFTSEREFPRHERRGRVQWRQPPAGSVPGNSAGDFKVRMGRRQRTGVILTATPIGGRRSANSGALNVAPGQVVEFKIGSVLRQSTAMVHDP